MSRSLKKEKKKEVFGLTFYTDPYDSFVKESIGEKGYFCFCNSHMLYEYHHKEGFGKVLESAKNRLPDGVPLLYSIRFFLKTRTERIAGNDVTFSLVDIAKKEKLKMFWIGGQQYILEIIAQKLKELNIEHEVYSPPFRSIEEFDFQNQAEMIQDFNPDIIMVGLGCPKQEIWMYEMSKLITKPMYGVGGAFSLFAGVDTRAPYFMRVLALEWIYRLFLEPKRLFKRYLITNSYFCVLFIYELFKKRK